MSLSSTQKINGAIFFSIILIPCVFVGTVFIRRMHSFEGTYFGRFRHEYTPLAHDAFDTYDAESEVLDAPVEDLSRWKDSGVVTAWVEIADWTRYPRLDLRLTDSAGSVAFYEGVVDPGVSRDANVIKSDDAFPDVDFSCGADKSRWEDFMLTNGTNFLFWELADVSGFDFSNVVRWEVVSGDESVPVEDVVVHDGLCRATNSLAGKWHAPNGMPAYGVWWPTEEGLVMRNVRQTQYPSNGDHARILSSTDTPKSFMMRARYTVTDIGASRKNSYIRFAWDFEDVFDPGHDESIVYQSLEYDYFGLQRVYPVVRYFKQEYEPSSDDQNAKARQKVRKGDVYELQVVVDGQEADVYLYELIAGVYYQRAHISRVFVRTRPMAGFPFVVETTGDVKIILHDFEVVAR